uniref:Secreted protein n=1 Tax=Panagrellus redivivus TaxID=6233 RepID=A0A7E4VBB5_PANRE
MATTTHTMNTGINKEMQILLGILLFRFGGHSAMWADTVLSQTIIRFPIVVGPPVNPFIPYRPRWRNVHRNGRAGCPTKVAFLC